MVNQAPNDVRNFVHKRIGGAIGGFLTGGITGAIGGAFRGGRSGGQPTVQPMSVQTFRPRSILSGSNVGTLGNRCTKNAAGIRGILINGQCFNPFSAPPGGQSIISQPVGDATMGRHGAGLAPFVENRTTRRCLPGMVLGNDGMCYNRRDIRNADREWPRGRRPLGTPGELAALAKAAAFGRRMKNTVKRMEKIGVLKKPSRGRARRPMPRPGVPAGMSIVNVE